jgi:flavin-dependent dehydrogenase
MKIFIVGGGLAGLISSIRLQRAGFEVTLAEKKSYPFHRVCGEYISNEVKPFLKRESLFPENIPYSDISKLWVTSLVGTPLFAKLDMGGFGISRYAYDMFLYQKAVAEGVKVLQKTTVSEVYFQENSFEITLSTQKKHYADIVIGAYGKRTALDKQLNRDFISKSSPYIGVKYHIKTDFDKDTIALHNFKDGYCGISAVENDIYNLCYLTTRKNLLAHGNIPAMQQHILQTNPYLKHIFTNADFLFDKPEVINEISFAPKKCVENHVLMCGDSAGLITPLCGNGMAIAIRASKILTDILISNRLQFERKQVEMQYQTQWKIHFQQRLRTGRVLQHLFGEKFTTEIAVQILKNTPFLLKKLITLTHGAPF